MFVNTCKRKSMPFDFLPITMNKFLACLSVSFLASSCLIASETLLTYSNRPMGSVEKPLLLRTFMPDISLGDEVLGRHIHGANSPKYNPKLGKDVKGEYQPISGLPAAMGVNYGAVLSYCWDTVECRMLYAWAGGFLDMTPYWGDPQRGNRQSFGYVPKLVGTLFYKAQGVHPVTINGVSLSEIKNPLVFQGYKIKGGHYEFFYQIGEYQIHTSIETGGRYVMKQRFRLVGEGVIGYRGNELKRISPQEIEVRLAGEKMAEYHGVKNKNLLKGGVNAAAGQKVFQSMACMTCHSIDGAKSHGPTLLGIHGSQRRIKGVENSVTADDAYILESIQSPNAKVVEGFPENYMPPYQLKEKEYKALLLYLKSLKKEAHD